MIPRRWKLPLRLIDNAVALFHIPPPHDVKKFVLLSSPRSGTTWIVDLLNSHPEVTCISEIFARDYFSQPPAGGRRDVTTWDAFSYMKLPALNRRQRLRLYFDYLDNEVYTPRFGTSAVGFKLMYEQILRGFGIPAYLKARQVSIIHLIRCNHLDVLLSQESWKIRNYFHAPKGMDVAPIRMTLHAESLIRRLEQREAVVKQAQQQLPDFGTPCLEVAYEDLLQDASRLDELLRYIGIEPGETALASSFQKLNPKNHRDLIENFDEIAAVLKQSRFADLLH